jgi:hypothetical protein
MKKMLHGKHLRKNEFVHAGGNVDGCRGRQLAGEPELPDRRGDRRPGTDIDARAIGTVEVSGSGRLSGA